MFTFLLQNGAFEDIWCIVGFMRWVYCACLGNVFVFLLFMSCIVCIVICVKAFNKISNKKMYILDFTRHFYFFFFIDWLQPLLLALARGQFNIKMPSYQYRNSHYKVRWSHGHHLFSIMENLAAGKMVRSLNWNRAHGFTAIQKSIWNSSKTHKHSEIWFIHFSCLTLLKCCTVRAWQWHCHALCKISKRLDN